MERPIIFGQFKIGPDDFPWSILLGTIALLTGGISSEGRGGEPPADEGVTWGGEDVSWGGDDEVIW